MSRRNHHHNNSNNNAFDSDPVHSADTSISSVNTEPHEPSTRRRVSPINTSVGAHVHHHDQSMTIATPLRKQNNPYMYNVLGENASPEVQARTSPIPRTPSPPMTVSQMPHHGRNLSIEWDDEPLHSPNTTVQHIVQPLTAPATPMMGGYMAAAYSSVFPPGKFPRTADEMMMPSAAFPSAGQSPTCSGRQHPQQQTAGTSSKQKQQRRPRNASPSAVQQPTSSAKVSPRSEEVPAPRETFTAPSSPLTTSPMTRVYINGRPIPVPAPAAVAA